ncbi:MAG: malic enzyme-like NAD(P)-binding protein [Methanobacterium sp.]
MFPEGSFTATGSTHPDVSWDGKSIPITQCNNALIFPGLGLGVICSRAKRMTSGMIDAAVVELSRSVELQDNHPTRLLPEVSRLQEVSKKIASTVVKQALSDGVAGVYHKKIVINWSKRTSGNLTMFPYKIKEFEASK